MDFPRRSSPPSIRIHSVNSSNNPLDKSRTVHGSAHERSSRSWSPQNSSNMQTISAYNISRAAMPIPNAREPIAPPALPPPRNLDISTNNDPGWKWGNTHNNRNGFGLAPFQAGSSLRGWSTRSELEERQEPHFVENRDRNDSDESTIRSLSEPDTRTSAAAQGSGPATIANYMSVFPGSLPPLSVYGLSTPSLNPGRVRKLAPNLWQNSLSLVHTSTSTLSAIGPCFVPKHSSALEGLRSASLNLILHSFLRSVRVLC